MLFLLGLIAGAILMVLAQRRTEAIRLRVERQFGPRTSTSWEPWRNQPPPAGFDRREWWREPR